MTNEIFDRQLALSLQRLEALWQRVDELPRPSGELWQPTDELPQQQQVHLIQSLEELSLSLQELQVAAEELRQQNEALSESRKAVEQERQHYQELFELAPNGYLLTDREASILEVNQTAAQLLNVSSERLVGKPLVVLVEPQERRDFYSQLQQFQKGDSIKNWQIQLQRWRGAALRVSFTVTPIQNPEGEVVSLRWQLQDLTPTENANVTRKQSDRLFRAMFERAVVGIALLDSQGQVLESNRALQEMLGYSAEELQQFFPKLLNLDEPGMESALFQQLIAGHRHSYQTEKRFHLPDQPIEWGQLTFSLVQGVGDEPAFATCTLQDITQLRQLKAAQQKAIQKQLDIKQQQAIQKLETSLNEQKNGSNPLLDTPNPQLAPLLEQLGKILNDILSSTPEFFLVYDRNGKYIYVNRAAANALGLSQSDFISKTWQQLELPAQVMEQLDAQRASVFATGQPITDEASLPTVDGIRDYEYTMKPISDINNNPEAVVVTIRDITEQKLAAVAVSEALAKEEEFSTLKSHFSYFVSVIVQELRNPLNNIFACTKLIESNAQQGADEKVLYYLQLIQVNVKRINYLLNNLLLIKKIEAKELQLNPSLLDLTEFCRELTEDIQQGAGFQHKIILTGECQSTDVCMDKKLLWHLLTNLLLNAVKSSPEGSEVKMEFACQGEQAVFHIQDSGSGISQADKELLFQFHQGIPISTVAASSLGLLIVRQCVELQGGEISADNAEGVGKTLTVTLPLHQPQLRVVKIN
jgi:PAS domain S-box-containing protein